MGHNDGNTMDKNMRVTVMLNKFGPNLMDGTRRVQLIEQGLRQGKAEAARVKAFWS